MVNKTDFKLKIYEFEHPLVSLMKDNYVFYCKWFLNDVFLFLAEVLSSHPKFL